MARRYREPRCPIRPGEKCTLCFPGATGPQDCGLIWLVIGDEDLRAELHRRTPEGRAAAAERAATRRDDAPGQLP